MDMGSSSAAPDSKPMGAPSPMTNEKTDVKLQASSLVKANATSLPKPAGVVISQMSASSAASSSVGVGAHSVPLSNGVANLSTMSQVPPSSVPTAVPAPRGVVPSSIESCQVPDALHQQREDLLRTFSSALGSATLGGSNGAANPLSVTPARTTAYGKGTAAEAASKRLGTSATGGGGQVGGGIGGFSAGVSESRVASSIMRYLHRDDSDPTGGAVCSLPGLDLHSEGDPATADPLPGVGKSFSSKNAMSGIDSTSSAAEAAAPKDPAMMPPPAPKGGEGGKGSNDNMKIPAMAASVISSDDTGAPASASASDAVSAGGSSTATSDGASDVSASSERAATANENATNLEQAAARNLGLRTVWTRSSAPQAPPAMLRAFSSSFSSLVDSRVRAWTLLLLRHSLTNRDEQSRGRLLGLLATSSSIVLTAVVTTFQPLSLPPEVKARVEAERKNNAKDENDVVLPVIFEALTDVTIQGQPFTVPLRAPGTISAKFSRESELMTYVEVKLDTNALVTSMVEQARIVVFKAVAKATSLPTSSLGIGNQSESSSKLSASQAAFGGGGASMATLNQFNSSLKLSKAGGSVNGQKFDVNNRPIEKKTPSVLRLSSYTSGKNSVTNQNSSGLIRTRKTRSVTWNHANDESREDLTNQPTSKRRKLDGSVSSLKKIRSFGKPDAGSFESQKNATFAEFGRSHQHNQVPTFINGKLHVPNGFQQDNLGGGATVGRSMHNLSANRNATFAGLGMSPRNGLVPQMIPGRTSGGANASFNLARNPTLTKMSRPGAQSRDTSNPFDLIRRNNTGLTRNNNSGLMRNNSGLMRNGTTGGNGMPRTATALESLLLSATKGGRSGMSHGMGRR